MANSKKEEAVAELTGKIKNANSIIFIDYQGISVNDDTKVRKEMREADVEYIVAKNRLFKIALKEAGVDENFDDTLKGTTSFAIGTTDSVAPARIAYKFGEGKEFFNIKSGYLDGQKLSVTEVENLAKLPSKEALLQQLLLAILGPIRKLAYGLVDLQSKKEEA